MKYFIFILLLLPCFAHSQVITGLTRFVVGGSGGGGGGTGVAIDYSYEAIPYAPIINVTYDPLRPNKQVTVPDGATLSFFMYYTPNGFGGNVRFIYGTGSSIVVNGTLTTPFAAGPLTVTKTYSEINNNPLLWN
jgi:hypothetical protein